MYFGENYIWTLNQPEGVEAFDIMTEFMSLNQHCYVQF